MPLPCARNNPGLFSSPSSASPPESQQLALRLLPPAPCWSFCLCWSCPCRRSFLASFRLIRFVAVLSFRSLRLRELRHQLRRVSLSTTLSAPVPHHHFPTCRTLCPHPGLSSWYPVSLLKWFIYLPMCWLSSCSAKGPCLLCFRAITLHVMGAQQVLRIEWRKRFLFKFT